jgi:hypothetical protein
MSRLWSEPQARRNEHQTSTAQMIIAADAIRRGDAEVSGATLTGSAKLIADAARQIGQAREARTDAGSMSSAARTILNADKRRRGHDIDEAL